MSSGSLLDHPAERFLTLSSPATVSSSVASGVACQGQARRRACPFSPPFTARRAIPWSRSPIRLWWVAVAGLFSCFVARPFCELDPAVTDRRAAVERRFGRVRKLKLEIRLQLSLSFWNSGDSPLEGTGIRTFGPPATVSSVAASSARLLGKDRRARDSGPAGGG